MTREKDYYKPCSKCDNDQCIFKGTDDTHNICEDYKPKDDKWIPVSERLPKPQDYYDKKSSDWVLVSIHLGTDYDVVRRAYYCFSDNKWYGYSLLSCDYDDRIVAWMPLPEPYKRGDET